ncbi:MAG TPA: methyltransferase domain-containing protein, partial [Prosthecobacter sp.]|nr:methyltransferase domain-containing protein [Prosthecobacter sp.]
VHPELATQFLIEDYYNLHLMEAGRFSAIVANAALVHLLDRADMPEILRQLHRLLRAGGVAFLRMLNKDGVTEEFDAVLFRYPRWFVYFSLPDLEQLARDAGFEILRGSEHPHHNFDNVSWPCVLLKKLA